MKKYVIRRIFLLFPMLLGISFITYFLINLSPSDPAEVALRINDITVTPEILEISREELGLNKPFFERYIIWLNNILHGDFGISYATKTPVLNEFFNAFPTTLILACITLILILTIGFGLGIFCALNEGKFSDKLVRFFIFFSTAMPSFWLGLLLLWLFSVRLNIFPTGGFETLKSMILPSFTLSLVYVSVYARMMRNSMIQVREEPFVLYAKARGLKKSTIDFHIIKNALRPCITALCMSIPKLLAGTVIVESIFALNGIGRICIQAIFNRDIPMIQAYVFLMACLFIIFNLFADIFVRYLDPRLRKNI